MKTITVAELRQNPTAALDDVAHGETYVVTRHRREIARLVPPPAQAGATAAELSAMIDATPLTDGWAAELAEQRRQVDESLDDPWRTSA